MSQDLTVNVKTTSDVPEAMERAKNAVKSFNAQIEGIGNKFGNSFQSIFLSYLGPMALVGAVIAFIGNKIAENQQKQDDANQAAIDGTNELMSAEDRYWANKRNNEAQAKKDPEQAKLKREQTTREFLQEDPRGKQITIEAGERAGYFGRSILFGAKDPAKDLIAQKQVQDLIDQDMKNNPEAGVNAADTIKAQTAAQKANDDADKAKGTSFKGPEGFSNVVGVGANPVMEAMTLQLEESRKQTALLEAIARTDLGLGVPVDYTKSTDSSPSRSSMLRGK